MLCIVVIVHTMYHTMYHIYITIIKMSTCLVGRGVRSWDEGLRKRFMYLAAWPWLKQRILGEIFAGIFVDKYFFHNIRKLIKSIPGPEVTLTRALP